MSNNKRFVTAPWERSAAPTYGKRTNIGSAAQKTSGAPWGRGPTVTKPAKKVIKAPTRQDKPTGKRIIAKQVKKSDKPKGKKIFKAAPSASRKVTASRKKIIKPQLKNNQSQGGKRMLAPSYKENNIFSNSPLGGVTKKSAKKIFPANNKTRIGAGVVPTSGEKKKHGKQIYARKHQNHFNKNMTAVEVAPPSGKGALQDHNKMDHLAGALNSAKKPTNRPNATFRHRLRGQNLSMSMR
eukprot:CAMPEP_0197533162 /NCGR_PEP_ID=MMETSP1318-20131121/42516_1 /TAXON_ID=552666 /ORGANISM="Partenskyella glossopodia, Strain RCC365" /LENGTH=238 /DNA_ID=CAMNT_0043089965 /DNA_START=46 /DNA_END=762 /DNA_ORIENTATION=+